MLNRLPGSPAMTAFSTMALPLARNDTAQTGAIANRPPDHNATNYLALLAEQKFSINSRHFRTIGGRQPRWLHIVAPQWLAMHDEVAAGAPASLHQKAQSTGHAVKTAVATKAPLDGIHRRITVVLTDHDNFVDVLASHDIHPASLTAFLQLNGIILVDSESAFIAGSDKLGVDAQRQIEVATICQQIRHVVMQPQFAQTLPTRLDFHGERLSPELSA